MHVYRYTSVVIPHKLRATYLRLRASSKSSFAAFGLWALALPSLCALLAPLRHACISLLCGGYGGPGNGGDTIG